MKRHDHRYSISRDRYAVWDSSGNPPIAGLRMTNSFGLDFANTITASEYKGAQKQKDKSGGYILVRYAP